MTQQTESTRNKISFILEQVGMSDEELYQLLYGRKQEVQIDISMPQLIDAEIWQATEHSPEELGTIESTLTTVEMLLDSSLDTGAIAQLEEMLEGEMIPDDARGLLLKKRFPNWRKGMGQFLAFLQFSSLMKLAMAMADTAASHLIPNFTNLQNRPQDRRVLSDFILQQLEKPTPPMIAALAGAGGILSHTGALEFTQPITAAIIGLDGISLAKIQKLLEKHIDEETPHFMDGKPDEPHYKAGHTITPQQNQKTADMMNKFIVLDRVEDLVAHKQMLHGQSQETGVAQQSRRSRSGGSRRRAMHEEQERQEKLVLENNTQAEQKTPTRSLQSMAAKPSIKTEPPQNTVLSESQKQMNSTRIKNSATTQTKKEIVAEPKKMSDIFAGLPLDALKGIKLEHIENSELGKTKSSVAKDNAVSAQAKPTPQLER